MTDIAAIDSLAQKKVLRTRAFLAGLQITMSISLTFLAVRSERSTLFLSIVATVYWVAALWFIGRVATFYIDMVAWSARISRYEQAVSDNPSSTRPAWDLASARLEQYVERNLSHVSWIFGLILLVMTAGFAIIGVGVYYVIHGGDVAPSVVATSSGIVVEFIAATFLLIYKSTMEQAQKYVGMLERINAVGMSAQLISNIDDTDQSLRNSSRAGLATSLLAMYGAIDSKAAKRFGRRPKSSKHTATHKSATSLD